MDWHSCGSGRRLFAGGQRLLVCDYEHSIGTSGILKWYICGILDAKTIKKEKSWY